MRVLVTGSVHTTDPEPLVGVLNQCLAEHPTMVLITGMAEGVDQIARAWAARHRVATWAEPLEAGDYPLPMHRYNERMLRWSPDLVIASKTNLDLAGNPDAGTEHMCRIARAADVPVRWLQAENETA